MGYVLDSSCLLDKSNTHFVHSLGRLGSLFGPTATQHSQLLGQRKELSIDPPVGEVLDLVDPDHPVLRGVGLFDHGQLKVFVADLGVPHPIVAGVLSTCLSIPGIVFVHSSMSLEQRQD